MTIVLALGTSLFGALLLAFVGDRRFAPHINIACSFITFVASVALALEALAAKNVILWRDILFVDSFNVFLTVITTFVSFTTALFSHGYMAHERKIGKVGHYRMRFYHAMYQLFIFAMLLVLLTNNVGVLWIAMELATLSTVLLVSLYRTPSAVEAAWKYFILCGVGIAQALFGTVLLYFAAEKVLGEGSNALLWTNLIAVSGSLEPTVLLLSFMFFMVGYGTKVGLAPLHNWLPDAHSEGPTPVSAILSGLLLNVALYALVRLKALVDGATGSHQAGYIMMGFGVLSILMAAFSLLRQKDIKRMFAYSSIEHMGIATFAFGLGGPIATYGALLHMLMHSLTKSSIFFAVGSASQMSGSQEMGRIKGLIKGNSSVGWGLVAGVIAITGLPPFGVFASEFLILTATMKDAPYLTPFFLLGLAVAFAALFRKTMPMVFGNPIVSHKEINVSHLPVLLHMGLVLGIGLYLPPFLNDWFHTAVTILTAK
jgi:hydrogenase-4 component F